MCSPARCPVCAKTTWSGCGQHVEQVKARVPHGQWCTCAQGANSGSQQPAQKLDLSGWLPSR